MDGIKERLKIIRKDNNLSQLDFGKSIGLSRSQIACYENGLKPVTDRSMNMICDKYNVNKNWLKTGTGEKYSISPAEEELAKALAEISLSDNEQLKQAAQKLSMLDDEYITIINNLIDALLKK